MFALVIQIEFLRGYSRNFLILNVTRIFWCKEQKGMSKTFVDPDFCGVCGAFMPIPNVKAGFTVCPGCGKKWIANEIRDQIRLVYKKVYNEDHDVTSKETEGTSTGPVVISKWDCLRFVRTIYPVNKPVVPYRRLLNGHTSLTVLTEEVIFRLTNCARNVAIRKHRTPRGRPDRPTKGWQCFSLV